jgi:hypothetical protein
MPPMPPTLTHSHHHEHAPFTQESGPVQWRIDPQGGIDIDFDFDVGSSDGGDDDDE